jgi:hypothetical protein
MASNSSPCVPQCDTVSSQQYLKGVANDGTWLSADIVVIKDRCVSSGMKGERLSSGMKGERLSSGMRGERRSSGKKQVERR